MVDDAPSLEPLANGTGYRVRVRYGKARSRIRIPTTDRDLATTRAAVLIDLGAQLGDVPPELARDLLEKAGAADGPGLERIKAAVAKLASGVKVRPVAQNPLALWTIENLGKAWTGGTLAKEHPDQIKARRAEEKDVSRLTRHIYPKVGDVRVSAFTLADAERVMGSLKRAPAKGSKRSARETSLSPATRRHVALILNRLLNLAVYPLKLRASNPIPKGFVPKVGKRRALAYLYPDEDRALLAKASIPIGERLLYGFLVREGCRVSEALGLRWSDIDLERGAVRLDKNKTDDPRAWALSPGVAAALAQFEGEPHELVFEPPADPLGMAEVLRGRLSEAGVERQELHKATAERIALRVHDLRGSFVTIALANGRSESWVADRTGHRSSQMLARYKRAARTADELKLGDWAPLDVALGLAKPKPANDGGGSSGPRITRLLRTPRAARRDRSRDRAARPKGLEPLTGGLETAANPSATSSSPSQTDGTIQITRPRRVHRSHRFAAERSRLVTMLLQGVVLTDEAEARPNDPGVRAFTVKEIAMILRVCTATVYAMVARGELPHVRVRNAIRVVVARSERQPR